MTNELIMYTIHLSTKNFNGWLTPEGYYSGSYEFSDRRDAVCFYDISIAKEVADNAYSTIRTNDTYIGLKSIYVSETSFDEDTETSFKVVYELEF